jgi:flagellar basal-body rod protein FlgG
MWISKTGVQAQDMKLQTIANNLANANTVGFKRDRAVFEDLFYSVEAQPGAQRADNNTLAPSGVQLGNGVHVVGTQKVFTQGILQTTQRDLDISVMGNGFLSVRQPNGETAYTRAGQLQVDQNGILVNASGLPLIPQITVPQGATSVAVGNDGSVSATLQGESAPTQLGQIELASFMNPAGLQSAGGNLLTETAASGTPQTGVAGLDGRGAIRSGYLEGSNVNVVEELVDMIETQRAYETNSKMIKSTDEMLQYVNQQL